MMFRDASKLCSQRGFNRFTFRLVVHPSLSLAFSVVSFLLVL